MTVDEVADWVEHSLQLPQFTENFRRNTITGYVFPLLNDKVLEQDLLIGSAFHRERLLRAIKTKLLAAGDEPDVPRTLVASHVSCLQVQLNWNAPADVATGVSPSSFPVHRYRVQRRKMAPVADAQWRTVFANAALGYGDVNVTRGERFEYRVQVTQPRGDVHIGPGDS